jgi:hypothetical protein
MRGVFLLTEREREKFNFDQMDAPHPVATKYGALTPAKVSNYHPK